MPPKQSSSLSRRCLEFVLVQVGRWSYDWVIKMCLTTMALACSSPRRWPTRTICLKCALRWRRAIQ
eukprot:5991363-Amphidinium_carterae.1